MLTSKEIKTIETLFAKMSSNDMEMVRELYNNAHRNLAKEAVGKFNVGDMVCFSCKDGTVKRGSVTKVNRKTVAVKVGHANWRVSPSLLRFQY